MPPIFCKVLFTGGRMTLIQRDALTDIRKHYKPEDVIVIHGARQVGKTCLLKLIAEDLTALGLTCHYIDLEDFRMLDLLNKGPEEVLSYLKQKGLLDESRLFLLVDEIQYLDNPTNLLKLIRDHYSKELKLIVSGSSSFEIRSKFKNSLAGRTVDFELHPLSFMEYLRFINCSIQIRTPVTSPSLIEELKHHYTEFVLYGGYPRVALETELQEKERYITQIINTYVRKDVRDLAQIRQIGKFNKLLEILASRCGTLLNVSKLSSYSGLSRQTVNDYLFIMEQTYVIELLRPFCRSIKTELFKMRKIFFYDTGLASILGERGFRKKVSGEMLENSIFAELRKIVSRKKLNYWRTKDNQKVDFILRQRDSIIPIEVKVSTPVRYPAALRYFTRHYNSQEPTFVVLNKTNSAEGLNLIYPWELYTLFL
jgi:predicted AAA+ superfamily ATPase